jgi:CRP-like cAMP-binding protein
VEKLADLAKRIGSSYTEGEIVFRQGEEGDTMYFIQEGAVAVIREGKGTGTVVARLNPGDFFGEMALVDGGPRSATVSAIEKTTLVPVSRDFLMKHSGQNNRFILAIIENLGNRLEKVDEMLRWRYSESETPPDPIEDQEIGEPRSAAFLGGFRSLADSSAPLKLTGGETVFGQGDSGDRMFIVLDGTVEIVQEAGKHELVQARFGRGDFFGEMALVTGRSRTATARSPCGATLLPVTRKAFLERVKADPDVAYHIVRTLILRLRKTLAALK